MKTIKTKKFLYSFLLLTLTSISGLLAVADHAGEYGFQSLTIPTGPSAISLGGNGGFIGTNAFSCLQNPAAQTHHEGTTISASQNYWLFDSNLSSIMVSNTKGPRTTSVGVRYLDYGKIDMTDDSGSFTGEQFHPMDAMITFGYARQFGIHQVGLNTHLLYEKIYTSSCRGIAFDLGYAAHLPNDLWTIYGALKNAGTTSKMDNESIDLPFSGEIGAVRHFSRKALELDSELKLKKAVDTDLQGVASIQLQYAKALQMRAAWKINHDAENFSLGAGFTIKKRLQIDYAYAPYEDDIDPVHAIGISYRY